MRAVIYLDLRGNGRSDAGPPDKWSREQWAYDVRQLTELRGWPAMRYGHEPALNELASDPLVTAVGGTQFSPTTMHRSTVWDLYPNTSG
jgi:hypothetical protein